VLRYVKRFLVLNPEQHDASAPVVDYLDMDAMLQRKLPAWQGSASAHRMSDVPFEMYAYISDSGSD
jgi:hypothetical protein